MMNKEQAIEHLKLIRLNAGMTGAESFKEALDLAIVSLSQPSLPSDIDEAAEEYAYNNWEDNDYHTGASEGLPFDAIGHTERCFKAGAEWKTLQGWKEVSEADYPKPDKNKLYCVRTNKPYRHYLSAIVILHPHDDGLCQWRCTEFPYHRYDMCEGDKYLEINQVKD